MSRARATIILASCAAFALAVVAVQAWRAARASADMASAASRLANVAEQIHRIERLRDSAATAEFGARPKEDLLSRASAVLADAGLPSAVLTDLTPQGDAPLPVVVGQPQYHRQSVRLALSPVTPQELGAFLNAWRRSERTWAVTRVELARANEPGLFQAIVHVSATYVSKDPS